jgi:general secretion pathway protein F
MPVFQYRGFDANGASREGILDADSAKEARLQLRGMRLHVTDLVPLESLTVSSAKRYLPSFLQRRHRQHITMLTRQLSTMLRSGIPLASCLTALIEQAGHPDLEIVLRDIREKVTQGATLADALSNHSGYFDDLFVNMVKAGETAGTLDEVLARLADFNQKQDRIRGKISAALAYPMVMVIFGAIVVIVLMTFVVPKIMDVIQRGPGGKDAVLPMPTRILIAVSGFTGEYWWLIIGSIITLWLLFRVSMKSDEFAYRVDAFRLRIPILGDLFRKSAVSRFCVTLATMLKSGIPALQALTIVQGIVGNRVLARVVSEVHEKIIEGADISGPIKRSGVFPPVVGYMIAVGEQAGTLEEMLTRVSEAYDEEVELSAQKVTSMIEPLLIVSMSIVVGFIVVAILLPILQIGQMASRR